jgi:hypothetical protein
MLSAAVLVCGLLFEAQAQETIGGGTLGSPAAGPDPSYGLGGSGFVLVKNWNFGGNGTIKNIADLNANFQYHDQFGTYNNGGNYGASIVASDAAHALSGQPVEGGNTGGLPVRSFLADSMKTYLVPLNGATTVTPSAHNAGCGSFQAKWTLPNGGSLLNQDILWETRVRYVTPPYFWFAIWCAGNQWTRPNGHTGGAEMDVIESFGYDNGGGNTNYDGRYWHSDSVGGYSSTSYANWATGMASHGISSFDATQWHTWTWLYRKDNTYSAYVDGILVQSGSMNWTNGNGAGGTPINMSFLFDGTWAHTQIASVNHSLDASALAGAYYEWDYSRVYLRPDPSIATFENEGLAKSASDGITLFSENYATGGWADRLDATAANDYAAYMVPVSQPGTYAIKARVKKYTSRGMFQLAIDGANQGSVQDEYGTATGSAAYAVLDLGAKTFATSGNKQFKFTVTGKNAGSPGYSLTFDNIQLIPRIWESESMSTVASDSITEFSESYAGNGAAARLDADAVNDYVTYTIPISQPGTYAIKVRVKKYTSRGMFQLAIDGANQGSVQDEYSTATGSAAYVLLDLGSKTFAIAGDKQFTFTVTGKNAASSGYSLAFDSIEVDQ